MSRPRNPVPSYRKHKQSGQAVTTLTDALGNRHDVLLGKHGTRASRVEYARVISEWEAAGRQLPRSVAHHDLTIAELVLRFWTHAEEHYRHSDGTPTGELADYRRSLKPLRVLYGHTLAKDFGPLALKAVRQAMVTGSYLTDKEKLQRQANGHPTILCRAVVNQRIGRIRRFFRWGVENELVPPSLVHGLEAVKGLDRGRSPAKDREPVGPVPVAFVEATLPHLLPTTADMVQLQLHTGMRPGEICVMRAVDIDMSGKVWLYKPASHKTAHRGHHRVIPLGPRAQQIIRRRLKTDLHAYLFRPIDAVQEKRERERQQRKTKRYPCEAKRVEAKKQRKPKNAPGEKYHPIAYAIAIRRAVVKANKTLAAEGKPLVPHWHPHQLRHTKATEIRREHGLDAARAVLGHRSPVVTEVYAEVDTAKAVEVAAKLG